MSNVPRRPSASTQIVAVPDASASSWPALSIETMAGASVPHVALVIARLPPDDRRAAATYADFLDRIEPAEWPYHAADVPARLSAAAAAAVRWRM